MANETAMNKPLDGAGLAVVNSVINDRLLQKAGRAELPTKTSQLVNDSGFITGRDVPEGAAASSATPKMDGTAFARGDHVHPTDTSRLASDGDGSGVTVSFNAAAEKAAPASGETLAVIMGKLAKNFAGLGELAYKGTVAAGDLDEAVRISLARADSALQSFVETDPTVPAWAKAAEKPVYTATEVGAIPLSMADSFARKNEVAGAYIYRGSVAGFDALPASGAAVGDVYNVEDTGMNYGWTGTAWDALGHMFQLDPLSEEEIKAILGVTA